MNKQILQIAAIIAILTLVIASYVISTAWRASEFSAKAGVDEYVVVELFTSQNCESCPPADKLLGTLAKDKNIIALGCHINYLDRPSWKDTAALQECSERQNNYAMAKQVGQVFTPELIINGGKGLNGSDESVVLEVLEQKQNEIISLNVGQLNSGNFIAKLPRGMSAQSMEAYFIPYIKDHTQHISGGDNRGKTLTYNNSVSTIIPIAIIGNDIMIPSLSAEQNGFGLLLHRRTSLGLGKVVAAGKWEKSSAK